MSAIGVVLLVLGILVFVAALSIVILVPVRRHARRVEGEMREELGSSVRRIESVRGLGTESLGKGQVRGNGTLALTADELWFRQWVPRRELRIPLSAIVDVGVEKWWLGKTVGRPLLRVRWRGDGGAEDAAAWQVADLDAWLNELRAVGGG